MLIGTGQSLSVDRGTGAFPAPPPVAYLISCNGAGERLLSSTQARGLFQAATANAALDVIGDMATGFGWRNPDTTPRSDITIRPLTADGLADWAVPDIPGHSQGRRA